MTADAREIFLLGMLAVLAVAMLLAFVRLVLGRSLPDRVVALDLIVTASIAMAGVHAVGTGRMVYLDVAIVLALVGFVGTVAFASYVTRKEHR